VAKGRTLGLKLKAIDKMSKTLNRVQRQFPKLSRDVKRASRTFQLFSAQTKSFSKGLRKIGGGMQSFGRNLSTFVTLPLIAAGAAGVKFFAEFEKGLRGVEKTTGLARGEVAKLGAKFAQLSTEIPVSTKEMLELAKAGGQLGVTGVANLEKFTVTMAKLGRASDVSGEEGAKSIARILKVTGTGIGDIDRFTSSLVELGNKAAAGESEILAVATRVAGQIGRFDVASAQVLGISTALKALGKNAESAGSVIGKSFDAIDQSIRKGGSRIKLLSTLTGIAGKDLRKTFKEDAAAVFQKFVNGLAKVEKGGGNLVAVMGALGLEGLRVNDIMGTLAKRPEVLAINMKRATKAFEENTALNKEFRIQTESLDSELILLKNTFVDLLTLVGKELAPAVSIMGKIFRGVFNFLRNNPSILTLVVILGALTAVIGPLLLVLGGLLVVLPTIMASMAALGVTSLAVISPFLLIAAAVLALTVGVIFLVAKWDQLNAFFDKNPFTSAIKSTILLLNPLGQLVSMIKLLTSAFSGLDAVKNTLSDVLPDSLVNAVFGGPTGAAKGARQQNRGIAGEKTTTEVGGQIDITLGGNVPSGTRGRVQQQGPVRLGLDLGLAGALQ